MSDYIQSKEYELPNGGKAVFNYNELGIGEITIEAMDALMDIVNSSQQWIPCSERLPEQNMTYRFDEVDMSEIPTGIVRSEIVLVTVLCEESGEPEYFVDDGFLRNDVWFCFNGYREYEHPFPVVAWMPLPQPWRGGTDEL